jgi:ankyrin repeat protein
MASREGHIEVVQLLLDRGADVNAQDDDLSTPLHFAARCGDLQVAEVLIKHDANPHLQNKNGRIPLQVAWKKSRDKLAQLLSQRAGEET